MTDFEYACPDTEQDAVALLAERGPETAILAAGTDLVPLLKASIVQPKRVVDISRIESLHGHRSQRRRVTIALSTLRRAAQPRPAEFPA